MTYTPGPWEIGTETEFRTQVRSLDGHHICYVEGAPVDGNAVLVAAVTDLLLACECALEYLDEADRVGIKWASTSAAGMRTAIAKAKGA